MRERAKQLTGRSWKWSTIVVGAVGAAAAALHSAAAAPRVDYARDVKPVLTARCIACHGALKQEAGLRLDTGHFIRKGGRLGRILIAGKPDASRLVTRVAAANPAHRMPPEGEPLGAEQIAALKAWIAQGATSPAGEKPEEDPRRHWAFQPVRKPAVPAAAVPGAQFRVRNPIDAFVAAEWKRHGLRPGPPAARETLLRRVYLDLVGLPPTREELHAFLADRSPSAYEKVVDRLLASPAYGERWGRHWMDVWRYSDWYGRRKESDVRNSYGQIWRWRDWIIHSLNADKPYDRMIVEMLAADEVAPEDHEAVAATGFLVRNWYSLNYNQWMRDNVEHTGKAFLGLRLNCAHCHDHKYDPITQREYFRFRAFFEPLELRHDRWPGDGDPGPFKKYVYGGSTAPLKSGMIRVFDEKLDAQTFFYDGGDERNRREDEPPVTPGIPAVFGAAVRIEPVALPAAGYYPGLKSFIRQEELARCRQAVEAARSAQPSAPAQLAVAEANLAALEAKIAADDARYGISQGNPETLARAASQAERQAKVRAAELQLATAEQLLKQAQGTAAVKPSAAAQTAVTQAEAKVAAARMAVTQAQKAAEAESTEYTPLSPLYPKQSTGRRRALAEWIASPSNPLTARVAVNHIWLRHFGQPLVDTVFDFGRSGARPTHPALLDWLAHYFAAGGGEQGSTPGGKAARSHVAGEQDGEWRMKRLHRLMVTSSVYRLDSRATAGVLAANRTRDRDNRYLWHYPSRRLEAEAIRDAVLHAAGSLDRTLGGPELDNKAETTPRRSLYYSVYAEDGGSMRLLETFDAPNTCDAYRRSESILPQQALALTNGRLVLEQGRVLARKLWKEASVKPDPATAVITAGFEQLLTRKPTAAELTACREFLHRQTALFRTTRTPIPATASEASGSAAEPERRAVESLIQALFSHNDFLTIR